MTELDSLFKFAVENHMEAELGVILSQLKKIQCAKHKDDCKACPQFYDYCNWPDDDPNYPPERDTEWLIGYFLGEAFDEEDKPAPVKNRSTPAWICPECSRFNDLYGPLAPNCPNCDKGMRRPETDDEWAR